MTHLLDISETSHKKVEDFGVIDSVATNSHAENPHPLVSLQDWADFGTKRIRICDLPKVQYPEHLATQPLGTVFNKCITVDN
ncbi:6762_t:CDS:2 [Rhizophagus irregularis]|nr:6762_t:CDS:2 [Rhizophagus irregularis]